MSAAAPASAPRPVRILQVIGLVWLALCLICGGLATALNTASAAGISASVCAGYTHSPHFQAGISWYLPISSYLPPLAASPTIFCLQIPYSIASLLLPSMAGQWAIPP